MSTDTATPTASELTAEQIKSLLNPTGQDIHALLASSRRIAVLGMKPESHGHQPSFYVPQYLQTVGYEVIPVPVYFPNVSTILGVQAFHALSELTAPIDIVNVFRRPDDIPQHLPELLALKPRAVWMQSGITHPQVAQSLAEHGIQVIQNRCIMVEHRMYLG